MSANRMSDGSGAPASTLTVIVEVSLIPLSFDAVSFNSYIPTVSVVKTGVNDVAWARVGLELGGEFITSQRNWLANSELLPSSVMGILGGTTRSSPACAIGLPGCLILPSALTYFVVKSGTSGAIDAARSAGLVGSAQNIVKFTNDNGMRPSSKTSCAIRSA